MSTTEACCSKPGDAVSWTWENTCFNAHILFPEALPKGCFLPDSRGHLSKVLAEEFQQWQVALTLNEKQQATSLL